MFVSHTWAIPKIKYKEKFIMNQTSENDKALSGINIMPMPQ
jgi:hypothetical protein